MLKPLLLSGWFRVRPFLNYAVVVILIAPLVAASGHSTSAKQSKVVTKVASGTGESESTSQKIAAVSGPDLAEILKVNQINSQSEESNSASGKVATFGELQPLQINKIESLLAEDYSRSNNGVPAADALAAVELAPLTEMSLHQLKLAEKLKSANIQSLTEKDNSLSGKMLRADSLAATQGDPNLRQSNPTSEIPVTEQSDEASVEQTDPIGSPHPIPWKWIVATQEAIGSQGSHGVGYYRSLPVVSPDGKYAVYSRVKIEVKPEMYNTRVTSVLFIEDRETRKLRVMASTTSASDPLLNTQVTLPEQLNTEGKIGVLVPVSWSEKSDRFLARKFEGVFNTGDSTDHAVIWDRQKNHANTVTPAQAEDEHEKIAVLLGWSKNQPDHVLFRAGEMGEENWPLVKVATDGKTVTTTDADQPITFGEKLTEVWAKPQVASR
jgi:hypothetical protein